MKRPYRSAPFGKMFGENFANSVNYSGRSTFAAQYPNVPYPRYDAAGGAWMTNYSGCPARGPVYHPYTSPLPQSAQGMTPINTYGTLANNIGESRDLREFP